MWNSARTLALAAGLAWFASVANAQVSSPAKGITDPKSIVSPANAASGPVPVADLFFTRASNSAAWSPDGKTVVLNTNLTGRFNIWRVDATGGWPVQLAQSDDRQSGLVISPDGKTLIFESDYAGNEMWDLFAVPLAGGAVVNLTRSADITEQNVHFSPDGKTIAFTYRPKDKSSSDVMVMTPADHTMRALTAEMDAAFTWSVAGWSGNDAVIATRSNFGRTKGGVWRVPLTGGRPEAVLVPDGDVMISASDVSPDGKRVAITSNEKSGIPQAALLDVTTRKTHWTAASPWEQRSGRFFPEGGQMTFITNVDGQAEVSLYDLAASKATAVSLPSGVNSVVLGPAGSMLVGHQASSTPFDYWIVDKPGASPRQLTRFALASMEPAALPTSRIVHYAGLDGTIISAVLIIPPNLKRDGTAPGVVLPHGGPAGQSVDSFDRTALALASRGYMVIEPNFRGSTGYGQAFQQANYKDLGGGDLSDVVQAAKFLAATGYVDAKRIGITGGSYGGFMTLMAVGRAPDVFAAAVSQYGIINWYEMMKTSGAALQAYQRSLIGDPVTDKAVYDAASPMTYIRKTKAPLLVLQGENDIRVPRAQAAEVVATLKSIGATVDATYYPGEGHGFVKRENQIDALQRTVDWFEKYLKPQRTP